MDYLVEYALNDIWCAPRQDYQFRFRPKRVSPGGGDYIKFESDWLQIWLPDNQNYYYVYQVGQIDPDFFNLVRVQNEWISFQDLCNQMGMVAEAYTQKGVLLAKFETYMFITKARNLLIATKKEDTLLGIDYDNEDIFVRTYTNAFWQSDRSNALTEKIVTQGKSPEIMQDILNMQGVFNTYRAKSPGYCYAIINGYWAEEISPLTCKVGDLVEFVYDSSITKTVEFDLGSLPSFDSTMDQTRKYLLHYADAMNRIEYQDDVDIFLIQRPDLPAKPNGIYHHKNTQVALRMVTHKDYSMSVQLINAFIDGNVNWQSPQNLKILLLIRESGFDRPLVYETNRIHELYKLPDDQIVPAMIGDNATVTNWQADTLESASYPLVMRSESTDVTRDMVQAALGYNAVSKYLGDTPSQVYTEEGANMVDLPLGLYEGATCYEYNAAGLLQGWQPHNDGLHYIPINTGCALVEAIQGSVTQQIDQLYDTQTQTLDPSLNYRMYVCDKISGIAQNNWKDVTGSGQYAVINNQLTWLINMTNFSTLVRSDKDILGYLFNQSMPDGVLEFDLIEYRMTNGVLGEESMVVPMGELDIFINGASAQEGLDYFVQFPKVMITNKRYLVNPENQAQQIVVRFTGFCKSDMTRELPEDRGFVQYGALSRNSVFNIRDDRVLRIVVDGGLKIRTALQFSEDGTLVTVPDALNGDPYSIRDIVVPMRNLADGDTYTWRTAAQAIDQRVSAYLSTRLPDPSTDVPDAIDGQYPIFTPFLCKILYDLVNGVIGIDQLKTQYNDDFVKQLCQPYEWMLPFDPTQTANAVDPNFVIIHPVFHNNVMNIDIYHFKFLQHVVSLYMPGLVKLNSFLRIASIS